MPDISVKSLLQQEIIAALKTEPAASHFNITEDLAGIYPAERLDIVDGMDPAVAPCAFVFMPEMSGVATPTESIIQAQLTSLVYLYFPQIANLDADVTRGAMVSAVMSTLAGKSYTSNMRKIGGFRNAAVVDEIGWVQRGQDKCFSLSVAYSLTFPSSGVVSIP